MVKKNYKYSINGFSSILGIAKMEHHGVIKIDFIYYLLLL